MAWEYQADMMMMKIYLHILVTNTENTPRTTDLASDISVVNLKQRSLTSFTSPVRVYPASF